MPLTWVDGPPGSGKTVFVISLLEKLKKDVLWYRADRGENNSADIFYFLNLAAQRNSHRKRIKLPVFTAEYADDSETFARIFFRELFAGLTDKTAIVFDNCQELEQDASFFSILQIAVSELPQGMQIYCVSRNRPASELNRMHLIKGLLEISANDLRFSDSESQAFLKLLNPEFDEKTVQNLHARTRGWAAGMVLLAEQCGFGCALERAADFAEHEFLFDYLATEILFQQEIEVREFLVKSALFTQLSADMGKQLTGCRQAKQFLDDLVAKNCLIERTAGSQPVYTYHPLLHELLLKQATTLFSESEWRTLQSKAAAILIEQDRAIEAISLYHQLLDWIALKDLLLQQADSLIKTGRHRSVSKWIQALPAQFLEEDAWLNYWYAEATKPVEPNVAVTLLDKSYNQFVADNDIIGIYSSWQAAVESICISMDDFSRLKVWFTRFDDLRKNHPLRLHLELKAKFYATAVQALTVYNPQHPWLKSLVRICERIVRIIPVKTVQATLYTQLGLSYSLSGHVSKIQIIAPYLESAMNDDSLPVNLRILDAFVLGMQKQYHGEGGKALALLHKGIELSDASGLLFFKGMLLAHIISCHICQGDLKAAEKALQNAFDSTCMRQRMHTALFHSFAAWVAALTGESALAFKQNQLALQLTQQIDVEVGYVCSLAFKAQFLAEMQQWQKAEQTFAVLSSVVEDKNNNFNLFQYHLTDAWVGYLQNERDRTLSALRQLFLIVRAENMLFFFGLRPEVLAPLCSLAIEQGIEEEFAIRMMQTNPLSPPPPLYLEKWPWPVRIYCFGHLQIELDGKPLEFSGKSQKKILDLLLAIIAMGGREVELQQLSQVLWPDSDGDFAIHALETAIHRLRKLIGKKTIIVNAGRVSLNDAICWIDLWALDQTVKELNAELNADVRTGHVVSLTDRLLRLYRGEFPSDGEFLHVKLTREQLQNKLFNLIDRLADFHEQRLEFSRACFLLERKLELDPIAESSYLRLMQHYIKRGKTATALKIFQQCERSLSDRLGVQLSAKIKSVAQQFV